MKVTGFSFVRNAVKFDYPIVEAITSILPLCDEFVVVVGDSDDDTRQLIDQINSEKIRIVPSIWDDSLREGGQVLADETNKGLATLAPDTDWAFYMQGDEVMHEQYIPVVREAMQTYLNDERVEGLLFKYLHFFGTYDWIGTSRKWYRREIRVVRHTGRVVSYRDAQGFRTDQNRKLRVKLIDAYIYHYGWVKSVETMRAKIGHASKFWSGSTFDQEAVNCEVAAFAYENHTDTLARFGGTHPAVMQERVARSNWSLQFDETRTNSSLKVRVLDAVERLTGWRVGEYRNYTLLRDRSVFQNRHPANASPPTNTATPTQINGLTGSSSDSVTTSS